MSTLQEAVDPTRDPRLLLFLSRYPKDSMAESVRLYQKHELDEAIRREPHRSTLRSNRAAIIAFHEAKMRDKAPAYIMRRTRRIAQWVVEQGDTPWKATAYRILVRIDCELPEEHDEFVYVYTRKNENGYKVGSTTQGWKRVAQQETGSSEPAVRLRQYLAPDGVTSKKAEKAMHNDLAPFHIKGEWFSCELEAIDAVAKQLGLHRYEG